MIDTEFSTPELISLLAKHFPDAQEEDLREAAVQIEVAILIGNRQEHNEAAKRPADKDIQKLIEARAQLERAKVRLSEIGIWGGDKLREVAKKISIAENEFDLEDDIPASDASSFISNHIESILRELPTPDAWKKAAKSEKRLKAKNGRPKQATPNLVASLLYGIFENILGKKPTIRNDRETNRKSGPFIDLVTDTFAFFKMKASAENAATRACRKKSGRKN